MPAVAGLSRTPQRQCQNGFSVGILLFQVHLEGAEVSGMHASLHHLRTWPCMVPSPAHDWQNAAAQLIRSIVAGPPSCIQLLVNEPARPKGPYLGHSIRELQLKRLSMAQQGMARASHNDQPARGCAIQLLQGLSSARRHRVRLPFRPPPKCLILGRRALGEDVSLLLS